MKDCCWRFNCISACGSNWRQRFIGKYLSSPANIPKKWFLYACMALLAILFQCYPGGTNSLVDSFALIATFYYFDISLFNTLFLVPNPDVFIHIIIFSYVFKIWDSVLLRRKCNLHRCGTQSWFTPYPCLTGTEIFLFDLSKLLLSGLQLW